MSVTARRVVTKRAVLARANLCPSERKMRCGAGFCHRRNHHVLPAVWFMAGFSRALPSVAMRMLVVNELRVEPEQQAILGVWGTSGFDPNPKTLGPNQPSAHV